MTTLSNPPRPIRDQAFPLWLDLVGVSRAHFDERAKEFSGSFVMGDFDKIRASLAIHECFGIPDNDLTAQLMLSRFMEEYAQDKTFTLHDLMTDEGGIQAKWTLARSIQAILGKEEFVFQRADFAASLAAAVAHYNAADREDIQAFLEDDMALAQLRRDAYYGIDELRINQFLDGDAGPAVRPGYNTMIRRWWRMEDLLAATTHLPEGVSLNLVCPGNEHELFFCFCVRRGARIYLLHDAPENEHPLQGQMSRSPGRHLERRMSKSWFPYDTAGVRLEDKGRKVRMEKDSQALALPNRFHDVCRPLCAISDLPPQELLWTVMMFDRIMDRFWDNEPLPQLPMTYAAGHLRVDTPVLVEEATTAGLPVSATTARRVAVPDLTREQVVSLDASGDDLGEVGLLHDKSWLLDRYADLVPSEAFNLVSAGHQHAQLTHDGNLEVNKGEPREVSFFERERAPVALNQLDAAHFGTAQELAADRKFIARSNLAKSVSVLAACEYQERHYQVREWLTEQYAKRKDFLLSLAGVAAKDGLRVVDWSVGEGPEFFSRSDKMLAVEKQDSAQQFAREEAASLSHALGVITPIKTEGSSYYAVGAFTPLLNAPTRPREKLACLATGANPSWFFVVRPTNAIELAWLLGMEREDLPDVLRNYTSLSTPNGNSILDRIDPMLWALKDPWAKFEKGIRLPLSKRGLAQLEKSAVTPDLASLHGASLRLYRGQDHLSIAPATPSPPSASTRRPR